MYNMFVVNGLYCWFTDNVFVMPPSLFHVSARHSPYLSLLLTRLHWTRYVWQFLDWFIECDFLETVIRFSFDITNENVYRHVIKTSSKFSFQKHLLWLRFYITFTPLIWKNCNWTSIRLGRNSSFGELLWYI